MVVSIVIKEDDIDDHYVVGRAAKTPVDIAHPVFRHLPRGKPFKIFSRNVRETDSQLQERILLSIAPAAAAATEGGTDQTSFRYRSCPPADLNVQHSTSSGVSQHDWFRCQ